MLPKTDYLTPQEYLAIEREAETKSEYFEGEMFAMAGASRQHNRIATDLVIVLGNQLRERDCEVFGSDMRVWIKKLDKYNYPDASVACGPSDPDDDEDILSDPVVLFEVLSPTTEAYDRGTKFEHYQLIDSLQTYVLIAQDKERVEVYERQKGFWTYYDYRSPEDVVPLPTIGCKLPLRDLYHRVRFSPDSEPS